MLRKTSVFFPLVLALFCVFRSDLVLAEMSSTNYQIHWDEISSGGGDSSSTSYNLRDSVSDSSSNEASSSSYSISQGFRAGIYDPVVDYVPYVQDRSTQVAAMGYKSVVLGGEITVTTTLGFSVGDYILVVQDEGENQVTTMVQISDIYGVILGFPTPSAGPVPTIDGINDYVYRMGTSTPINFGTLLSTSVVTHTIGWTVTADVEDGYSVYVFSDGDLRSDSDSIPGVSDGSVSTGSSEYGGRSSDSSLLTSTFDTQDTAFSSTPLLVASNSAHPFVIPGFVTLKVGISSSQTGGNYGQVLTVIFVGEY